MDPTFDTASIDTKTLSRHYHLHDAADLCRIDRVLLISLKHHGDVLLSTPVVQCIKARRPRATIDVLCYHQSQAILSEHPDINRIYTLIKSTASEIKKSQRLSTEFKLIKKLQTRRYDLIIHLSEHWRGALISLLCQSRYSVAADYPKRRSWLWRLSFSHLYPLVEHRSRIEQNLDALRRLGLIPIKGQCQPRIYYSDSDAEWAKKQLATLKTKHPRILLHPSARWMFKTWPPALFSALIGHLKKEALELVISSGPDTRERHFVADIIANTPATILDLSGQTSLTQLAALIDQCDLFIGVDSVAMHMAHALDKQRLAIFGPSNEHIWYHGTSKSRLITDISPCRPCEQDGCGGGKISECLLNISPEHVANTAIALLKQTPPAPSQKTTAAQAHSNHVLNFIDQTMGCQ